jgi:hypothetical protein
VESAAENPCTRERTKTHPVGDNLLDGEQPGLPLALVDADAPDVLDLDRLQRVLGREADGNLHGLLVDNVRCRHLVDGGQDLDRQAVVLKVGQSRRLAQRRELVRNDVRRKVA